ncbi:MAG: cytochrome P450 [Mycobacteriaceae bacterium]|nr:cytochrome P450 [Mycobacteriaceae bacterium]
MATLSAAVREPAPLLPGRLRNTRQFISEPIGFFTAATARRGDVFRFQLVNATLVGLTHPRHIKRVLQDRQANFVRDTQMYDIIEPFVGRGLATIADHDRWRRNRRIAQPAFDHKKLDTLAEIMASEVSALCDEWAGHARAGRQVDLVEQMSLLTLRIVVRSLFGLEPNGPEVAGFAHAAKQANAELGRFVRMPLVPLSVPTPSHRRFWRAIRDMDAIVYGVINRLRDTDSEGLLSMFMRAADPDTDERMTDRELRDEVVTMLFAGHETSSSALTSALLLLQAHPDVRERLRADVDATLGGRPATAADLPALPFGRQVLEEVLRLRPPAWMGQRSAVADDEIGGYLVPAGTTVMYSYYHAHRNPECWERPEDFNPNRFADKTVARDRNIYLPFGAGGHLCIGQAFAMMEMQLALAAITARFEVTIPDPDYTPMSALTLNAKYPVLATLTERAG